MDRHASEKKICAELFKVSRDSMTYEQIRDFVSRYGIPWWLEPTPELIAMCPIRLRPATKK